MLITLIGITRIYDGKYYNVNPLSSTNYYFTNQSTSLQFDKRRCISQIFVREWENEVFKNRFSYFFLYEKLKINPNYFFLANIEPYHSPVDSYDTTQLANFAPQFFHHIKFFLFSVLYFCFQFTVNS